MRIGTSFYIWPIRNLVNNLKISQTFQLFARSEREQTSYIFSLLPQKVCVNNTVLKLSLWVICFWKSTLAYHERRESLNLLNESLNGQELTWLLIGGHHHMLGMLCTSLSLLYFNPDLFYDLLPILIISPHKDGPRRTLINPVKPCTYKHTMSAKRKPVLMLHSSVQTNQNSINLSQDRRFLY